MTTLLHDAVFCPQDVFSGNPKWLFRRRVAYIASMEVNEVIHQTDTVSLYIGGMSKPTQQATMHFSYIVSIEWPPPTLTLSIKSKLKNLENQRNEAVSINEQGCQ